MYFNTKNTSIYYEKYGTKDKVILILPGWGNTRTTFTNIINFFKEDYTIYIIDYPGFGNSPIPQDELTIYDYTNIIRDFLEENNIVNPIIIAHSFGGRITTLLAGYYKEKIDKIIYIDAATIKPKKTLKRFLKEKTYKLLKKLIKLFPKLKQEYYKQKLLRIFGSSDYESEVLLLWGKLDDTTPLKDGYKMNNLIKDSALIIFPKGNHFSYLQYPYLTNQIIQEFIKEQKK